jgi:hypothetical protein
MIRRALAPPDPKIVISLPIKCEVDGVAELSLPLGVI